MATWQNKVYVLGGESYTSQRSDDPAFVHVLDTSSSFARFCRTLLTPCSQARSSTPPTRLVPPSRVSLASPRSPSWPTLFKPFLPPRQPHPQPPVTVRTARLLKATPSSAQSQRSASVRRLRLPPFARSATAFYLPTRPRASAKPAVPPQTALSSPAFPSQVNTRPRRSPSAPRQAQRVLHRPERR